MCLFYEWRSLYYDNVLAGNSVTVSRPRGAREIERTLSPPRVDFIVALLKMTAVRRNFIRTARRSTLITAKYYTSPCRVGRIIVFITTQKTH